MGAVVERRSLTDRAEKGIRLWSLRACAGGHQVMACHIRRARRIVKEHIAACRLAETVDTLELSVADRDELKLVYYPGDVLPTFLGRHDNVLVLSGPAVGEPRFITATEVARLMGHPIGPTSPFGIAARLMRELRLYALVCDSLHTLFGAQLVGDGWQRAGWSDSSRVRYGSLMGGGLDGFFPAVRAASGPVEYCMQADVDPKRAAVLLAAHGVGASFASAAAAAEYFTGELDALTLTAPCQLLSTSRHTSAEEAAELARRADAETRAAWKAFETLVRRCRPKVVMLEQVASMQTHHASLYRWFGAQLASLPYEFAHGVVDAASDLHAIHSRRRLGWVGVAVAAVD